MNQFNHIEKLKLKIILLLGAIDYEFIIVRQTPFSSTFKLITKSKIYYIKTFKTFKTYYNEVQFSKECIEKMNLTPHICFFSTHKCPHFPFFLIRESDHTISIDQLLSGKNGITESICFNIGEKLSQFNSLNNSILKYDKFNIKFLINKEYNYFHKFIENNVNYFNLAINNSNEIKTKTIIFNQHNNISNFIKLIDTDLKITINKILLHKTKEGLYGLVHGDLWCQNILINKLNNDIRFIDFNHTHFGDIYIDIIRFKLRGTSIYPYYSIDELHIVDSLWSNFISGYNSFQKKLITFDKEKEFIISLYLLIRTLNHYLNLTWDDYLDTDSKKDIHYSKLLKIVIVLYRFINTPII